VSGKIEVTYEPSGKTARVPEGTTLFNAAHWAGLPIESTCGGRGTCGKCGVRVTSGRVEPSLADFRHLADKVEDGWRLSCQAEIKEAIVCEVPRLMKMPKAATMGVGRFVLLEPNVVKLHLQLAPPSLTDHRSHLRRVLDAVEEAGYSRNYDWEVLPRVAEAMRNENTDVTATLVGEYLVDLEPGDTTDRMFGASFDIGTTTCVCTLVDLRNGAAVAVASTINHQAPFGADVIARMAKAMHGPENIEQLREAAISTVNELLGRVREEAGVGRDEVYEAVVAGNATMLHLLCGVNPESIALAPYVATFVEPQDLRVDQARFDMHPLGWVALFPSIGAYVGADIVADIVATGLVRDPEVRLLVDVGTNGEIACGSAERSVATAAPAGPAFEGGEIRHGMRATDGAIEGVVLTDGTVELQVIGGDVEPRGICGSGLIDIVAQLRLVGLLDDGGKMMSHEEALAARHPLADRLVAVEDVKAFMLAGDVVLTQQDVRALQFAKGAISTGIETAMRALGVSAEDLDEVMLAGSFGSYIHPQSARVVGLVPPVPVERIKAVGNTASEGAKMALMSFREREVAWEIPAIVEYIELSGEEDFNDRFIGNLGFPSLQELAAAQVANAAAIEARRAAAEGDDEAASIAAGEGA
jgi:uncharacterized 2Fe-2S/4Fe-4S cluster protein (DUF4445 family)